MKFKGKLFGRKSSDKSKSKDETEDKAPEITTESGDAPAALNETEGVMQPRTITEDEENQGAQVSEIQADVVAKGGKNITKDEQFPSTSAYTKQSKIKPRGRGLHPIKDVVQLASASGSSSDDKSEEAKVDSPGVPQPPAIATASPPEKSKPTIPRPMKEVERRSLSPSPEPEMPDEFGKDMGEMDWAKRVFYMSAERVFPGFRRSSQTRRIGRNLCSTTSRSSLILGMLLVGSHYFNFPWGIGWLCLIGLKLPTLKKVHGGLIVGCSILYFAMNFLRIGVGVKGNSMDDAQQLGIYWMTSALVQLPLITFFLLTDFFSPVFFPFTTIMDIISAILLWAELIFGFVHLNSIISNELKVLRQAQETWKLTTRKSRVPNREGGVYSGEPIGRSEIKGDQDGASSASESESSEDSELEEEITKNVTREVSAST